MGVVKKPFNTPEINTVKVPTHRTTDIFKNNNVLIREEEEEPTAAEEVIAVEKFASEEKNGPVIEEADHVASAVDSVLNGIPLEEETPSESDKYYQLQNEYIEKYLSRGDFDYDVNADELYLAFRDQTLDAAEKSRRHAQAQAAGLTGGYGSTYAAAAGNAAYADIAAGLDTAIPEFYASAREKYDREGKNLLERADIAGAYADKLAGENLDIDELMNLFNGGDSDGDTEDEAARFEAEQKAKYGKYEYENPGNRSSLEDYEGDTSPMALANALYEAGFDSDDIRDQLLSMMTSSGARITGDVVDYVMSQITNLDKAAHLSSLKDSNGVTLTSFYEELVRRESAGKISADDVITALLSWRDENGKPLDEEYLLYMVSNL